MSENYSNTGGEVLDRLMPGVQIVSALTDEVCTRRASRFVDNPPMPYLGDWDKKRAKDESIKMATTGNIDYIPKSGGLYHCIFLGAVSGAYADNMRQRLAKHASKRFKRGSRWSDLYSLPDQDKRFLERFFEEVNQEDGRVIIPSGAQTSTLTGDIRLSLDEPIEPYVFQSVEDIRKIVESAQNQNKLVEIDYLSNMSSWHYAREARMREIYENAFRTHTSRGPRTYSFDKVRQAVLIDHSASVELSQELALTLRVSPAASGKYELTMEIIKVAPGKRKLNDSALTTLQADFERFEQENV